MRSRAGHSRWLLSLGLGVWSLALACPASAMGPMLNMAHQGAHAGAAGAPDGHMVALWLLLLSPYVLIGTGAAVFLHLRRRAGRTSSEGAPKLS